MDGRVLAVQCPALVDLLPLLSAPPVYLLLGTLTDRAEDLPWLYGLLLGYRSPLTDELLESVADALVLSWCGVERWFATRLWEEALTMWPSLDGRMLSRGVDIAALAPARATRLVWVWLQEHHAQDKDKGDGWRRRLQTAPVPFSVRDRTRKPGPSTAAADANAFMSVYAATGGRVR